MNETVGLRLVRGTDLDALASGLIASLGGPGADPFLRPLVFTPSAGVTRWLSQRIARSGDPGGEGVCAGVRFEPLARLEELVSGERPADDPWAPERLVWAVLELAESAVPGLEPLRHHLDASEQRYANGVRVARLLDRYARLRPALLRAWSEAADPAALGLGFDAWQPALWRALHAVVPGPDPVARRDALLADLAGGARGLDAPSVAVFGPRQLTEPDADLLAALAAARPVDVWLRLDGPEESAHPLAVRLGVRGRQTARLLAERATRVSDLPARQRPQTWLGALQDDLAAGRAPADRRLEASDRTLDVHATHGPGRQAEVLRETLAGLFDDDPTLEPRDVVVICPDPGALAPHVEAAFGAGSGHPAATFRLQVADRGAAETNLLYGLVREVAQLGATRATASQLLALAAHPFVARRFGFSADDGERLAELVEHAAIRWGLGEAHRASYGLPLVRQGTWQVGVQRLLLGEALSEDTLAAAGVIAPVDDVESSDAPLLGGLAELVSRVSRLARRPERAPAAGWLDHLQAIVDLLADVPFEASGQLAQWWSAIDELRRRAGDSPALLGQADALALLDAEFERRQSRPAFGNGSLVVCGLGALAQVPHRVVCLVGLDERTFPRRGLADGDDLLAADPRPGEPDPGRDDRQAILDAVGAAQERLVVIYQGWSAHTREHRPPPPGVVDLLEAAAAVRGLEPQEAAGLVRDEPLQPFSPALFGPEPRSFDAGALRAARALVAPRRGPAPERFDLGRLTPGEPASLLELDQVRGFLVHPARYLLRERAQLSLGDDEPPAEELPLEADPLARWAVGNRVLGRLLAGHPVEAAQRAEWLSGELPPGHLGRRLLDAATATAVRVADDARPYLQEPARAHTVDLTLGGVRLSGRAVTRGPVTLAAEFSRVGPKHLVAAWLDALALTVTLDRPVDAVLFGGGRRVRLAAPEPEAARAVLDDLVSLAAEGRRRLLPLPPRVGQLWAQCRARNAEPQADRGLDQRWRWERDAAWKALLPAGAKPWDDRCAGEPWAQRGEPTLLGSLAALVWRPIVGAER